MMLGDICYPSFDYIYIRVEHKHWNNFNLILMVGFKIMLFSAADHNNLRTHIEILKD